MNGSTVALVLYGLGVAQATWLTAQICDLQKVPRPRWWGHLIWPVFVIIAIPLWAINRLFKRPQ